MYYCRLGKVTDHCVILSGEGLNGFRFCFPRENVEIGKRGQGFVCAMSIEMGDPLFH